MIDPVLQDRNAGAQVCEQRGIGVIRNHRKT